MAAFPCADLQHDAADAGEIGPNLSLNIEQSWDIHPKMKAEIDEFDRKILAELQPGRDSVRRSALRADKHCRATPAGGG